MTETKPARAHLIAGGFPPGSMGGHDHDYARLRLLTLLAERVCASRPLEKPLLIELQRLAKFASPSGSAQRA